MSRTPEGAVKDAIKNLLRAHGAYFVMPMGTGYGKAGVPDFVVCAYGHFVGIEAKAGKGKPTALQDANMVQIVRAGGLTLVVNEQTFPQLENMLHELKEQHDKTI